MTASKEEQSLDIVTNAMKRFKALKFFIFFISLANMSHAKITTKDFFSKLNSQTMHLVEEFYDDKIHFIDPLGEHKGIASIKKYYENLYSGAEYVRFDFDRQLISGNDEVLFWRMTLKSKNLNNGLEYTVPGNSHFSFSSTTGKCIYHRDYFDMGDFIYERVPLLKHVISFVKSKLKGP